MTRYYKGPLDQQPRNCGRLHPQSLCLCVMCEIATRFENVIMRGGELGAVKALIEISARFTVIVKPQGELALLKALRAADGPDV